jgi:transposase
MVSVIEFFHALKPHLNEKTRRLVAAALTIGGERGTTSQVSKETGVSFREIRRGLTELELPPHKSVGFRDKGGGRKKITQKDPEILTALKELVDSTTRGDPESPLLWTCKSLRVLANELKVSGHKVSYHTVGTLLEDLGYSLQGNRKVLECSSHPDRNEQFEFINKKVKAFIKLNQPIISVDCKKHELVGNYKNNGKEWHEKGNLIKVKDHDFMDKELGKAIPYGVYDQINNKGYVNIGITHDTSVFAVNSIKNWWYSCGLDLYPKAKRLLITADCGGSNGYRRRLWKTELAKFSNESNLIITVCHFPVGTSKWIKVEHRLFQQLAIIGEANH